MTEKDRMLQGLLYKAGDPVLVKERAACKDLCWAYNNQLLPSQEPEQIALLERLLGKMGEACCIIAPFWCDYGYNIEIGSHFFANHNCVILDTAKVVFGSHVNVGPNCCFAAACHPLDAALRREGWEYSKPIRIGDGVWLGAGVTVLPGVTVGENAVIGAGSLVSRDIPPGVVALGNPCRVVRQITAQDREKLPAR